MSQSLSLDSLGSSTLMRQSSNVKSIEKQKTIVDGIEFFTAADHNKFSFKRTATAALQDEISEDSNSTVSVDEETPEGKHRNFEFTNNVSLMRVIRACLFFQVIGIICDNPDVQFPPLFNVLCRSPLYYCIRFYSRPFVDIVYLIQMSGLHLYHMGYDFIMPYLKNDFKITYDIPGMPVRRLTDYMRYCSNGSYCGMFALIVLVCYFVDIDAAILTIMASRLISCGPATGMLSFTSLTTSWALVSSYFPSSCC
jgi:hypothetical protein